MQDPIYFTFGVKPTLHVGTEKTETKSMLLDRYLKKQKGMKDKHFGIPSMAMRFLGQSFDSRDIISLTRILITKSAKLNSKA